MKFKTETTVLREALNKLGFAVNPKALLPALTNILAEVKPGSVTLTSSDMQISIQYNIICETEGEGEFLFPYAEMKSIVALEDGAASISFTEEEGCIATFDKDVFNFGKEAAKDFPRFKTIAESKLQPISKDVLTAIKMASLSVSKDELRPAMMRVCLELSNEKITVVATDSHCMYVQQIASENKIEETTELLLPAVISKVLDGELYDVELGFNKNTIAFKFGPIKITAIRGEGKFPNWRAVMPEHVQCLSVGIDALKDAVNKAYVVSDSTYNGIDFKLSENNLLIETKNIDSGMGCAINVEAQSTSQVNHVRFNGRLLKRMIAQLDSSDALLSFSIATPTKPVTIRVEGVENTTVLIMPITIQ